MESCPTSVTRGDSPGAQDGRDARSQALLQSSYLMASTIELALFDEAWDALVSARRLYHLLDPASKKLRKVMADHQLYAELAKRFDSQFPGSSATLTPPSEIAGLKLEGQTAVKLHRQVAKAPENKGFEYPWPGLERYLQMQGSSSILLFGYGSLLNRASASETISEHMVDLHEKAVAFGVVRLLDYDMPPAVAQRSAYRGHTENLDRGLFNLRFTGFWRLCHRNPDGDTD